MVCPYSGVRTHVCGQSCVLKNIQDLGHIMQDGFQYDDNTIQVTLNCIVCDAEVNRARAMATKPFSGYHGCERCDQKGVWYGRVTYPDEEKMVTNTSKFVKKKLKAAEVSQVLLDEYHQSSVIRGFTQHPDALMPNSSQGMWRTSTSIG